MSRDAGPDSPIIISTTIDPTLRAFSMYFCLVKCGRIRETQKQREEGEEQEEEEKVAGLRHYHSAATSTTRLVFSTRNKEGTLARISI